METLTVTAFRWLLERNSRWECETTVYPEGHDRSSAHTKDGEEHDTAWGYVKTVSRYREICVTWTQSYSFFLFEPSTLVYGDNGGEPSLTVEGFRVVDEDGNELTEEDLEDIVQEYPWFTLHDDGVFRKLEGFREVEQIGSGPETEDVHRDYRPDACVHYDGFKGVTSREFGSTRWEEAEFFGLEDGVFIAWASYSLWEKEPSLHDGEAFTGEDYKERAAQWLKAKTCKELTDKALEVLKNWLEVR